MMLSEILIDFNLLIKMTWSTESKALENSVSRHRTYFLVFNIIDIVSLSLTIAVVELPVLLKPNLSNISARIIDENICSFSILAQVQ